MAARQVLLSTFALFWIFLSNCQAQLAGSSNFSITPATLTLTPEQADGGGGKVTFTCGKSDLPHDGLLYGLTINEEQGKGNITSLVGASTLGENTGIVVQFDTESLQEGSFTMSGNISQKFISLTLLNVTCKDSGRNFTCQASAQTTDFVTKIYESSSVLKVTAEEKGNITLTTKSDVTSLQIGDILDISCDIAFDAKLNQSQIEWNWDSLESIQSGKTEWKAFSEIRNADDNITQGDALSKTGCYVKHHSTLRRRLTGDDAARLFRCCVRLGEGEPSCQTLSVGTKAGASKGGQNNVVTISLIAVSSGLALGILMMTYYNVVIKQRLRDREQLLAQREEALQRAYQMRTASGVTSQNQETVDSESTVSSSIASSQATDATDTTETQSYF